jgi:nucleotide-binding universal stress UspA family protein
MSESLSHELRGQGRDFVVILLKGRGAVKPRVVRVECPRIEPMPDTPEKSRATALQLRKILLPTDFSGCANYALPYAAAIARAAGATIVCVHVVEPIVPAVGYSGLAEPMPIADMSDQLEDSAERELPALAECEEFDGLTVEEVIVHGDAAAEIVRVAAEREVDLIVVSSHGRTGLGRIIFGSTAEAVVRHASCPVLVVKPPPREEEEPD